MLPEAAEHPQDRFNGNGGAAAAASGLAAPSSATAASKAAGAAADAAAPQAAPAERELLQQRLAGLLIGALTSNCLFLGDKLGLYRGLADYGPCTATQLAAALGLNERYTAEWLRQQASAHIISADEAADKFWLTAAQQDVLVREHGPDASPHFFMGFFSAMPAVAQTAAEQLPELFAHGGGISYNEMGKEVTCGICRELGVWARHELVPSLRAMPDIAAALEAGCMVADVGCGCGVALLAAAEAFSASTFHGYDISEDALREAKAEAARRGLTNVAFLNSGLDEEAMPGVGTYQLVMTHDAIHDMAHPQAVMAAVRKAVAPGGCWIIGDMGALDSHGANVHSHPLAPLLYGFSVHCCLPSGLSAIDGAGLGTMGISVGLMGHMLREAGFASVEVLEAWKHPLNRYYIAKV